MSATCPRGHLSETADYCDECGVPIVAGTIELPAFRAVEAAPEPAPPPSFGPATPAELCPSCQAPRAGGDQFCEGCGYEFASGKPPSRPVAPAQEAGGWEVVVTADRAYYAKFAADGIEFPPHYPPRTFALSGDEVRVGRDHPSRGIRLEIDLAGAPEDPGISRLHVLLVRESDGAYALLDPGSTNGVMLNDDDTPVAADVPVPLKEGDSVHLGAWTTMTVRAVRRP